MLSQISSPVPDTKPASDAEIGLIMSVDGAGQNDRRPQPANHRHAEISAGGGCRLGASDGSGSEKIAVSRLELPPELIGQKLELEIGENHTFTLSSDDGELVKAK